MLPTLNCSFPWPDESNRRPDENAWHIQRTAQLYDRLSLRGRLGRAWARLTGRTRQLHDLAIVTSAHPIVARHSLGTQSVPIDQIRGSENRSLDFDRDFNPLSTQTRARWLSIATARLCGAAMPAIDLIQIGDDYFVRDGHHRISVAHALGEAYIDANVTVWAIGPQPDRCFASNGQQPVYG
jgi:hypothetical protein